MTDTRAWRRVRIGWTGLLLFCCALAGRAAESFVLEMELASLQGGAAQLFYDVGQWYSGRDSARVEIPAGETLRRYRFAIPAKPVKRLRFDPADGAATVWVGRMRLLTADGRELARFGPEHLVPMHAIASLRVESGLARVETEADDPMLLIVRPLHAESVRALGKALVSPSAVIGLGVVVALLAGAGLFGAMRAVQEKGSVVIFAGSFLIVAGARLWWLKHFSRPLPFWDDWKTSAIDLLMPLGGGFLDWETIVAPHGEHRIVVTRVITLVGSIINGEWDPRVAMTAGALFFAGSVALLCAFAVRVGQRRGLVAVVALLACGCLPFDTRNIYWGDQSQMYALQITAVITIVIAAAAQRARWTWIAAVAAGGVSLFTMGSGFVAPGIAAGVCAWRARREGDRRSRLWLLAGVFAALTIAGVTLYRTAPFQSSDYARTWTQFFAAFVGRAAWPLPAHIGCAGVVWLPWLLVTLGVWRARRSEPIEWIAFGVGAWALVNAVGLAHGRSQEPPPFDSKYYTAMALGGFAALLSLAALMARWWEQPRRTALAAIAVLVPVVLLVSFGVTGIQGSRDQFNARGANDDLVRAFLAKGDPAQLRATPWHQLPYWNGAELADLLDAPLLQPWLAAPYRTALTQRPGSALRGVQEPGALTLGVRTLMKLGPVFIALGVALLVWFAVSGRALGDRPPWGGARYGR